MADLSLLIIGMVVPLATRRQVKARGAQVSTDVRSVNLAVHAAAFLGMTSAVSARIMPLNFRAAAHHHFYFCVFGRNVFE